MVFTNRGFIASVKPFDSWRPKKVENEENQNQANTIILISVPLSTAYSCLKVLWGRDRGNKAPVCERNRLNNVTILQESFLQNQILKQNISNDLFKNVIWFKI